MSELQSSAPIKNHGWAVTFAGMGINLALGILYTWSVFSKGIPAEWGWSETDKSLPYMFACLIFSLVMVPAGRMQDKIGPRITATIGGLLVGLGLIFASRNTSPLGLLSRFRDSFGCRLRLWICFGNAAGRQVVSRRKNRPDRRAGGLRIRPGVALCRPPEPMAHRHLQYPDSGTDPRRRVFDHCGRISPTAPPPPPGYSAVKLASPAASASAPTKNSKKENFEAGEMLKTPQFYLMWFMYACGSGAGLMVIAKLAAIADKQAGIQLGFVLVAMLAIGNGGGRIVAGMLSDRIGRKATLFLCFVVQAILIMLLSIPKDGTVLATVPVLSVLSALIGANYGANLSLFPSLTKDYFGLKNFGVNYGLVFTSWGVGGFMLSYLAGKMYDKYNTFAIAYYGASILLVIAAAMVFMLKHPRPVEQSNIQHA